MPLRLITSCTLSDKDIMHCVATWLPDHFQINICDASIDIELRSVFTCLPALLWRAMDFPIPVTFWSAEIFVKFEIEMRPIPPHFWMKSEHRCKHSQLCWPTDTLWQTLYRNPKLRIFDSHWWSKAEKLNSLHRVTDSRCDISSSCNRRSQGYLYHGKFLL